MCGYDDLLIFTVVGDVLDKAAQIAMRQMVLWFLHQDEVALICRRERQLYLDRILLTFPYKVERYFVEVGILRLEPANLLSRQCHLGASLRFANTPSPK